MQLVALPKYEHKEGDVAPQATEVLCTHLQAEKQDEMEGEESGSMLHHHSAPPPQDHFRPSIPSATSTYDIPGNTRKRKPEEEEDGEKEKRRKVVRKTEEEQRSMKEVERVRQYLLLRRKLLMYQRKLMAQAGQTDVKLPLCYVYSDLLRSLPAKLITGGGGQGRGRRKSPVPDLSTPIDSSHHPLEASSHVSQSRSLPLFHLTDSVDTQSLEKCGFSQEWFSSILHDLLRDLNEYGVCVVDAFLGAKRADRILEEVNYLHSLGVFQAGQVVSKNVQDQDVQGKIRGDKITWVTGSEPNCSAIGQLVSVVDSVVARANKHQDAGKLAQYNITWRTRAMVACYPGQDSHYVMHVDNPNGDGRCITAIYYLNKNWTEEDGGVLRIYPENCTDKIALIEPRYDRMLFFWSDRRNPHEVLPAKMTRYAITVWYLDQKEREEYLARKPESST